MTEQVQEVKYAEDYSKTHVFVQFKKLDAKAVMPSYANIGDVGADLTATSVKHVPATVEEAAYYEYGTGLAIKIPEGYGGFIFPRSSVSKKDLFLANAVGVIDPGYVGEVKLRFKYKTDPKSFIAWAVRATTGMSRVASSALSRATTPRPSSPGSDMSRRIRSGLRPGHEDPVLRVISRRTQRSFRIARSVARLSALSSDAATLAAFRSPARRRGTGARPAPAAGPPRASVRAGPSRPRSRAAAATSSARSTSPFLISW